MEQAAYNLALELAHQQKLTKVSAKIQTDGFVCTCQLLVGQHNFAWDNKVLNTHDPVSPGEVIEFQFVSGTAG